MKFVFFARDDFKSAPNSLKVTFAATSVLAIAIFSEFVLSGSVLGLAPDINLGWGALGFFLAYIVYDGANTMLRKRKVGFGLTYLSGLTAMIVGILSFIAWSNYLGIGVALLGSLIIASMNSRKSKTFLAS